MALTWKIEQLNCKPSFDGKTKEPVTIKVEDGLQELTSMHPGKF